VRGLSAVVIGASISGLCAATVLSEFYEHVTVVERDSLPGMPRPRAGVPQGRHQHVLLARGLLAFGELFPGLVDDLAAQDVPTGDVLADGRTYLYGLRLARTHGDLPALGVTRPYLEWQIRRRLQAQTNVHIMSPYTITELLATPDCRAITGVRMTTEGSSEPIVLPADLVVDASGRRSRTPSWLATLGYRPPHEERFRIDVAYASWGVRAPADLLGGDLGIAVGVTRANPRAGSIIRVEDGKWLVSLLGYGDNAPPSKLDDCLEFARRLAVPDIYGALREATAQERPVHFQIRHSVRRHYQRLARFPEGLVVLGDAACCFNPIYGQGMSVAAVQALILRDRLRQGRPSVASLRRQLAQAGDVAWAMSVGGDLHLPWVSGRRTLAVRAANAYMTLLPRAAHRDPAMARAFFRVAHLLERPASLARPTLAARLLLGSARRGDRLTPAGQAGRQDIAAREK
jgi:2-polyprenyl-6-methoxyphenol hydroxylase-like FAD-dependent oxidoreductase